MNSRQVTSPTPQPKPTPRRELQLSVILARLQQEAGPEAVSTGAPVAAELNSQPEVAAHGSRRRRKRRKNRPPRVQSKITVGEILDQTKQAGFGFIAAFLALVAIPFFGLSTPFGLAIAFVGGQMVAGLEHPWLPRKLRAHHVTMTTLGWLGTKVARWTRGLERVIRPRFQLMLAGPFWVACGLGIVIQGLALALPLPIPGSNWIFILPIILYGIGLLESDGLLIMICHTITLAELLAGVVAWEIVTRAIHDSMRWLTAAVS